MANNNPNKKTTANTANRWGDPVFEIVKPAPETPAALADEKLQKAAGGGITVKDWIVHEYEITLDDTTDENN